MVGRVSGNNNNFLGLIDYHRSITVYVGPIVYLLSMQRKMAVSQSSWEFAFRRRRMSVIGRRLKSLS